MITILQEEHHPLPKEHNKSAPRPNKKSSFNIKQFFERAVPNDLSDFVRSRMTSMAIDPSGYSCMYQINWQIQATNVKILSTYMYMYIYTICKCIVNSVYAKQWVVWFILMIGDEELCNKPLSFIIINPHPQCRLKKGDIV